MLDKKNILNIKKFSINLRKSILEMAFSAGSSSAHLGGALSIADILSVLFSYIMKINKNPKWENRDRFILSKGHGCLAYYAALCEIGYISKKELETFEKDNSNLLGHPVINRALGIDFSNGSLGMGLSLGIGVSLSLKQKKKNNNTYVVLGDGECNEGSIWEAAMAASNFNLNNLFAIIDKNNFQQTGKNKEIMNLNNLKSNWKSFGWDTYEVDGHNFVDLVKVFQLKNNSKKPKAIIANTVKGKGISFAENNNAWHHSILTKSLYDQGLSELNKSIK